MSTLRFDLHTHSTASDGMFSPAAVVALAATRGLTGIALTDHDTVAGQAEALAAGVEHGVRCISGIELSCSSPQAGEVHLLGYFFDVEDRGIAALVESQHRARMRRAELVVERVRALSGELTIEDVLHESGGAAPGRPHIARAMVARGIVGSVDDAFGPDWFGYRGRAYVRRDAVEVERAIHVLHEAGGVAVFAHPGSRTRREVIREAAVRHAAEHGLDGVEVDHPDHDDEAMLRCAALARELDLVETAGSDDHGTGVSGSRLGSRTVPLAVIEQLEARAARWRA